jgi:hypothetical protein
MTRATIPATAIDEAPAAALPSMLQNFFASSLTLGLKCVPHDAKHNDIWRNDIQHNTKLKTTLSLMTMIPGVVMLSRERES